MKREDVLLQIIVAAEGESLSPAQLQKVTFLLGQELPVDDLPADYYKFEKYGYGPFSVEVFRDAERLQREGLITITLNPGGRWKEYAATPRGLRQEGCAIPQTVADFVTRKVKWAKGFSFQRLIGEVYRQYPEYRENSVFQE